MLGSSVPTPSLFQKDGQDVAGIMNPTLETPINESLWHSYIAVKNVDECAKRAPNSRVFILKLAPADQIAELLRTQEGTIF